jgi:hypothetical protein
VFACLIIRGLWLVVELQRKLEVPRRLGADTSNRDQFGTGAGPCVLQVKVTIVAKVEGQQPVEACRLPLPMPMGVAKLPDARGQLVPLFMWLQPKRASFTRLGPTLRVQSSMVL